MTLVKETGEGLSNANSYASVADADSYHEAHLYASDWTGASDETKTAALQMATRLIDGCYQFNGHQSSEDQALQWPREGCHNPDRNYGIVSALSGHLNRQRVFDSDEIPVQLVNACCEMARELIKADSSDAVDGEGLSKLSIAGGINLEFDKKDKQPTIPPTAQLFLSKLGSLLNGNSVTVKLVRV